MEMPFLCVVICCILLIATVFTMNWHLILVFWTLFVLEFLFWAVNSWCFARAVTVTAAHNNLYIVLNFVSQFLLLFSFWRNSLLAVLFAVCLAISLLSAVDLHYANYSHPQPLITFLLCCRGVFCFGLVLFWVSPPHGSMVLVNKAIMQVSL